MTDESDETELNENRRRLITGAAVVGVGLAVGGNAAAQQARDRPAPTAQAAQMQSMPVNPNAVALMPNGERLTRAQILTRLGLDGEAAMDGWLVIAACGVNMSALRTDQIRRLVRQRRIDPATLDEGTRRAIEQR